MRKAIESGELSFIKREPRVARSDAPFIGSGTGSLNCSAASIGERVH
jgi:hypothetical protein